MENIKKSPSNYQQAAELARLAGEDLLMQLPWMAIQPTVVVEMGCGTGEQTSTLQKYYPDAQIIAIDISASMLRYHKTQHHDDDNNIYLLQADGAQLPLFPQSVDLIFANFFLAWQGDITLFFYEWLRILRPNGLAIFNLFGPDTIKEYRDCLCEQWLPGMIDLHDLGDMLLKEGFCDPVIATDFYTFKYKNSMHMLNELYQSDLLLSLPDVSNKTFTQETHSITFEVVTAHAFAPRRENKLEKSSATGTTRIPLAILHEQLASHKRKT